MESPRFLARGVVLAVLLALAQSCAFPKQGCLQSVCNRLDSSLTKYQVLLNNDTFNYADKTRTVGWGQDGLQDIGYFFGVYNQMYNGGKYDPNKWAGRDAAPSVNYFELRNDFGVYKSKPKTIGACCNLCRTTPGCQLYMFNPYIINPNYDYGDDYTEENAQPRSFWPGGTGDCMLVSGDIDTYNAINGFCTNSTTGDGTAVEGDFYNPTVKPIFYGGLCNTGATDDPHFVGARGTRFDFNGQLDKSFCLVTDTRLQLNALLRGYQDPRTETGIRSWMKELGVNWIDAAGQRHTLYLAARTGPQKTRGAGFLARAVLDGAAVGVPGEPGARLVRGDLELQFVGTRQRGPFDIDEFQLRIGGLLDLNIAMRVAHPLLQTARDAQVHFNLMFARIQGSDHVHGVLGQTYRQTSSQRTKAIEYSILSRVLGGPVQADGESGKGFLDGEVQDYITSSVLSTDCKFSTFGSQ